MVVVREGMGERLLINVGLLSSLPREGKTTLSPEKYTTDHLRA